MKAPVITLFLALFFNAFANIMMKYGVRERPVVTDAGIRTLVVSYLTNGHLMLGILFFGIALVFYSKTLERMNLSIAYPIMTSSGILIVTLWSLLFFGEHLSPWQWVGIGLIIAGLWLVNLQ